jgi:hypothetical protein
MSATRDFSDDGYRPRMATSNGSRRSLVAGAAGGLGAYVLGYLVTYLTAAGPIRESFAQRLLEFVTGEPGTWKMVGWVFYNAHLVKTYVPGPFGTDAVDLIAQSDALSAGLYLLPVVLLAVAGAVAALASDAESPKRGAVAGGATVLAYFPLCVAGAFLFGIQLGDSTAAPSLVTAALLAGLVYPVVLGGVGGAVAGALR